MNKFKAIVASIVVSTAALAAVAIPVSAATNANSDANSTSNAKCTVSDFGMAMGKSGNITVNGTTATVKFRVNGANCTTPVSVASWIRVTADGINDQKLYAHKTQTFGPGLNTMTIQVPNCMFQVDLVEGAKYTAADGTANYQFQNGKFVDGGLRDFIKGGSGTCEEKVVVVEKPVIKTVTKTKTNTVTKTVAAPVTAVPETGADAGSMLASTMGLSTSTGLAFNLLKKRRLLK